MKLKNDVIDNLFDVTKMVIVLGLLGVVSAVIVGGATLGYYVAFSLWWW